MLGVFSVLLLLSQKTSGLVCPPIQFGSAIHQFKDGADGSCYSEVDNGYTRSEIYTACGSYNSYLPVVINAFQNSVVQQKSQQGGIFGQKLPGMWLGLTCTGNIPTSCSWDDGTVLTGTSYSNFDAGFLNATIGPCIYQETTTGRWRSESCSLRKDIGFYCKFTPSNNVPMCSPSNMTINPHPMNQNPDYFGGNCYSLYYSNNVDEAEGICTAICGYLVSIHSEGENAFVRDLLVNLWNTDAWSNRGYLGIKAGGSQWLDGTSFDYTNFVSAEFDSENCSFISADESSQVSPGGWFHGNCTQPLTRSVVCKKTLVNDCDAPFVPFPTTTPILCNGPEYLNISGTLYSRIFFLSLDLWASLCS